MNAQTITVLPTHPADAREAVLFYTTSPLAAAKELMADADLRSDLMHEACATESYDVWVIGDAAASLRVVLYVTGYDEDMALERQHEAFLAMEADERAGR